MATDRPRDSARVGRLYLVPNTLDFGAVADAGAPLDVQDTLPLAALQVAARLRHWAVENARSARALLKRVDAVVPLAQPLQTLNVQELPRPAKGGGRPAPEAQWLALLEPALAGEDVGLLSEAGLPAVADPGARLVQAAHAAGVPVLPLSGPSSLMLALSASGLNGQSFAFVGYLPVEASARAQRVRELEGLSRRLDQTQLLIETPYRNAAMLDTLLASLSPQTWLHISCAVTVPGGWSLTRRVAQWRDRPPELPNNRPAVFAFQA
jgi:16S rRNA (cytidine1402-2'-O)-methyltransferase